MPDWGLAFLIIGIAALLDSMIVFMFPKWSYKCVRKWIKKKTTLKKIAWTEFIIGIILVILGLNI